MFFISHNHGVESTSIICGIQKKKLYFYLIGLRNRFHKKTQKYYYYYYDCCCLNWTVEINKKNWVNLETKCRQYQIRYWMDTIISFIHGIRIGRANCKRIKELLFTTENIFQSNCFIIR